MNALPVTIAAGSDQTVSGLLMIPEPATACYVMAHGAGAGMTHPFMASVASGLSDRGVATLRYQFPFMEHGSRRPDRPTLAQATVRAAVAEATRLLPAMPLFAGGKSFGARMTSQAQAAAALPGVRGLAFLGFPLHPAGKPSDERARHLFDVHIPMLFLQGTRDALAETRLLLPLSESLGGDVTMRLSEHADHSFHVPARSGRTDQQTLGEMLDDLAGWMTTVVNRIDG
jgi:predicted alpha/beta-hydrolase family hydrolase